MIVALVILILVALTATVLGMTVLGARADRSRLKAFHEWRKAPMPDTIHDTVTELRGHARSRSFGLIDNDRRAAVEHGYLLALEDVERLLSEDDEATASPRDAA